MDGRDSGAASLGRRTTKPQGWREFCLHKAVHDTNKKKPSDPPPSNRGSCGTYRAATDLCNRIRCLSTATRLSSHCRRRTPVQRISAACCCCRMAHQYSAAAASPTTTSPPSALEMNFNAAFHSRGTTLAHSPLSSRNTSGADPLSLIGPRVQERPGQAIGAAPPACTSIPAGGGALAS